MISLALNVAAFLFLAFIAIGLLSGIGAFFEGPEIKSPATKTGRFTYKGIDCG